MECVACKATWDEKKGSTCPQCQYDNSGEHLRDTSAILSHRKNFQDRVTEFNPKSRVNTWDRLKPWLGAVLGFIIFMLWLRACSTHGWKIF